MIRILKPAAIPSRNDLKRVFPRLLSSVELRSIKRIATRIAGKKGSSRGALSTAHKTVFQNPGGETGLIVCGCRQHRAHNLSSAHDLRPCLAAEVGRYLEIHLDGGMNFDQPIGPETHTRVTDVCGATLVPRGFTASAVAYGQLNIKPPGARRIVF